MSIISREESSGQQNAAKWRGGGGIWAAMGGSQPTTFMFELDDVANLTTAGQVGKVSVFEIGDESELHDWVIRHVYEV